MRKAMWTVVALLACGFQGEDQEPVRRWKPGDRCVLFAVDAGGQSLVEVAGGVDYATWLELEKSSNAKDEKGFIDLLKSDLVRVIPSGTKANVIELRDMGDEKDVGDAWEVRILDGEFAGELVWVTDYEMRGIPSALGPGIAPGAGVEGYGKAILAGDKKMFFEMCEAFISEGAKLTGAAKQNQRLLRNAGARLEIKLAAILDKYGRSIDDAADVFARGFECNWPIPVEPIAKKVTASVTTTMRLAKALESTNKTAAIRYYKDVIAKFPKSPEAATAKARIKALGGKD